MQKILIATKNKGKVAEITEVLGDLSFDFVSLLDLNINEDVEEDKESYEENAKLKAEFFGAIAKLPTIADDSGIIVEALKGELGVKTRRWGAGEHASDEQWLEYFLNRLKDEENRSAEFFSSICYYNGRESHFFNGSCKGKLLREKKCDSLPGIPLSSVFVPDGFDSPYSMLSVDQKNQVSHRGKAAFALKEFLERL